ncbi:hypothetical protein E1J25_06090 [Xanthomonas hortorum pv. taraxaci]|nr:hypothetical protein [Xanthomonas hortorum pv. taraxaci]
MMINPFKRWQERRRQHAVEELQRQVGLSLNRVIDAHGDATQQPEPPEVESLWLNEPFRSITTQNVAYGQHFQAMDFVLQMLIVTHPDPELLLRTWQSNVTHRSDSQFDEAAPLGNAELKQTALNAWQQVIEHFSTFIEDVAKARKGQRPDHD